MPGRVIAALLSTFLLFATTGFPQCDYRLQYSGEYRASILDVFIDGSDLWTASGYGVQLYDRSVDPPRLVAPAGIAGLTRVVRAANGIAYAAGTNGIAVVRRNGRVLQVVRTIATAAVNDLLLRPNALFAATTSGIIEFDLLDPLNPARTAASFPTSSVSVSSLATVGSTLYVADGDPSIESFSIVIPSSPQTSGALTSILRASSLAAVGTRLYVSDGQRTEVFASNGPSLTSVGLIPFPSSSIADAGSNVIFAAGRDRQIRAIDASVPANAVELFDTEIAPSGGTVNRVTAMRSAGGRLYVGGGDTGLSTYDISHFASPFPLRAYGVGPTTSVVVLPNAVYSGRATGGIQEMTRSSSGGLVVARQWSSAVEIVQDGAPGFLISSSGPKLSFWTLASTVPALISTATFRAGVRTAFLAGSSAIVLLDDGTLWTADMSQNAPVPVRVAPSVGSLWQLAHSGGGTAATEISGDGTTAIYYWDASFGAPTRSVVAGVTTALALNVSTAAVFTFRGITLVQLGTPPPSQPVETLLPGSNTAVIKAIEIANGKVIALTEQNTLRIWDIATARLEKEFVVPGGAVALDAAQESTVAAVATSTGVATINYATATSQPSLIARTGGNSYYRKAAATASRLYLFDGRIVDVYELGSTPAPRSLTSIFAPGAIDIAASETTVFTLSNSGIVTAFSRDGVQIRSNAINEGGDVVPLAIAVVNGAPWISFSRGCTTTGCEKRTVVLDPQSLVRTASLAGGIVDVTTSGARAYGLFDLPSEVRVYDVSDALHPAVSSSRATDVAAVSIAYSNGTVYLLADKAYAYSEASLTRTGEQLTAQSPSSFADLLIDSGCATISGRSPLVETYTLPQWAASSGLPVPGSIRSMTLSGGRLLILTDYSIEVWSRSPALPPPRRRAV